MSEEQEARASAGIVIFRPDEAELARLVGTLRFSVREVVIFANSPVDGPLEAKLQAAAVPAVLAVLRPGGNVGLGAAYDALLARADGAGDAFLLLLDQDSLPPDGTVAELASLHRRLRDEGETPAIVGPRPVDPDGQPMRIAARAAAPPHALGDEVTRVSFVISSGSLVDVAAAREVGPFRADYFIDAIDLEWCFRADARGFSIWVAERVLMDHRLGRGVIRLPFGLLLADQPPRRLYTFLRNQLSMLRLPHVPLAHKAKTLLTLPIRLPVYLARNGFSRECRSAILRGLRDGLGNRLGPPPALP